MLLPERPMRAACVALAFALVAPLAGCTVGPVYGDREQGDALTLAYAAPTNRLEQVAYRVLTRRLPPSDQAGAPRLALEVSVDTERFGLSSVDRPTTEREVRALIAYSVSQNDQVLASGERIARASVNTNGQIVADDRAVVAAQERAVAAAAEAVRLALLAQL